MHRVVTYQVVHTPGILAVVLRTTETVGIIVRGISYKKRRKKKNSCIAKNNATLFYSKAKARL